MVRPETIDWWGGWDEIRIELIGAAPGVIRALIGVRLLTSDLVPDLQCKAHVNVNLNNALHKNNHNDDFIVWNDLE